MQTNALPSRMPTPFADSGTKNTIPVASQVGVTAGLASFTTGFPPLTMTPIAAGGVPPLGADFNGILNAITQALRWANAGMGYPFDAAFSASVNGYPKGALLPNSTFTGFWLNTAEANGIAPEAADASLTGWVPAISVGVTTVALTSSSVTLTSLQAAKDRIVVSGALTANVSLFLPAWARKWTITNNCSGAFTVTVSTTAGTGVAIPINTTAEVFGDGANISLSNPLLVQAGTQPGHAVNLGQAIASFSAPVGSMRNASMSVAAASAIATFTADEIVVETSLGGQPYRLTSFSQTINLGNVGAGGMDAGAAPASGYVALYAIYNPTTKASSILATNATSAKAPSIYGGAAMPAGYTASGLISVWPTNSSGQLAICHQVDRTFYTPLIQALNTTQGQSSWAPLNVAAAVPPNAREVSGLAVTNSSPNASNNSWAVAGSSAGVGYQSSGSNNSGNQSNFTRIPVVEQQKIYYQIFFGNSPTSAGVYISSYTI